MRLTFRIVSIVDDSNVKYESFNHWHNKAYSKHRELVIPKENIVEFNGNNNTINIDLKKNYIKVKDKYLHINKKVKRQELCASLDYMRKVSYAFELTKTDNSIKFYELYTTDDLDLTEEEFYSKIQDNYVKKVKTK